MKHFLTHSLPRKSFMPDDFVHISFFLFLQRVRIHTRPNWRTLLVLLYVQIGGEYLVVLHWTKKDCTLFYSYNYHVEDLKEVVYNSFHSLCVFTDVDIYIRTHFDCFLLIFNEKGQPKYMYFWIMLYSCSNFMIFFGIISLEVVKTETMHRICCM